MPPASVMKFNGTTVPYDSPDRSCVLTSFPSVAYTRTSNLWYSRVLILMENLPLLGFGYMMIAPGASTSSICAAQDDTSKDADDVAEHPAADVTEYVTAVSPGKRKEGVTRPLVPAPPHVPPAGDAVTWKAGSLEHTISAGTFWNVITGFGFTVIIAALEVEAPQEFETTTRTRTPFCAARAGKVNVAAVAPFTSV